jgi:hypothetical protein
MTLIIGWATALLTALVGGTAAAGVFAGGVYARETTSWAAQGIGQDAADLFVALPCLIVSAILAIRGSLRGSLIWLGIVLYFVYSYVLYAFFVHFGPLFPAYVATLGVSFYSFALAWRAVDPVKAAAAFGPRTPVRSVGGLLVVFAAMFACLWSSEIVPNAIAGTTPPSLAEVGLIVNPVHVLDLAFVLPAMALAGILLWRRQPLGYPLAAVMLSFSALMGAAILGMDVSMFRRGLLRSLSAALPIGVVTALSVIALWLFLRRVTRREIAR